MKKLFLFTFCLLANLAILYSQKTWKNYFSGASIYDINIGDSIMWIRTESKFVEYNMRLDKPIFHNQFNYDIDGIGNANVLLDSDGNYWATSYGNGIYKYDGKNWINYTPLGEKNFNYITPGKNGQIWLSDFWNGNLILFKDTVILAEKIQGIKSMVYDSVNLWINTTYNIIKYNGILFDTIETPFSDSSCNEFQSIFCDKFNNIWISGNYAKSITQDEWECQDYSSYLCKFSNGIWRCFTEDNSELPSGSLNSLQIDEDSAIWISSGVGLYYYNSLKWKFYDIPEISKNDVFHNYKVTTFVIDSNNTFLIGVLNDGLYKKTSSSLEKIETSNSKLTGNKVLKIGVDKNGSNWILSNDFSLLKDTIWSMPNYSDAPVSTFDFTTDKDGNLYFITDAVYKFNGNTFRRYEIDVHVSGPYDLAYDNNSDIIWIGAQWNGLLRYDFVNWDYYSYIDLDIFHNYEKFVAIDSKSWIWLVSQYDIVAMYNGEITYQLDRAFMPNAICIDNKDRIWVGGGGLSVLDNNIWSAIKLWEANLSSTIYTCACDENNVWFGLFDGGLLRFDGEDWFIYNTENSQLPNNTVNAILINNNIKYIGTNHGISVFDGYDGNKISLSKTVITDIDDAVYDNQNVSFYPNPAKNIISTKGLNQLPGKVVITDLYGRIIKNKDYNYQQDELYIDISFLNKGIYIIQLINNSSEIKTGKIIVE